MLKGQVSVEFLLITGFAFLLLVPVLILFVIEAQDMNEDVTSVQVHKLADELLDAANNVYYLGEPTQKTISIYVPGHITAATFTDNRIMFNVSTDASEYVVVRYTAGNVTGNLNINPGMHTIKVTAQGNKVNIEG